MEKQSNNLTPCPFLPKAEDEMSFRDLKNGKAEGADALFTVAQCYSQFLWMKGEPARAILALLRAVYLEPEKFRNPVIQPYRAYRWFLENDKRAGFLGNPRISFAHQATRITEMEVLKRSRAWAMWHLTRQACPDLPADPATREYPPAMDALAERLNRMGHPEEGKHWIQAMRLPAS